MTKRNDTFEKKPRDFYPTPKEGVLPLLPHLETNYYIFAEPCAGKLDLAQHICQLSSLGCYWASDIQGIDEDGLFVPSMDALELSEEELEGCDCIITNPPWSWDPLEKMIVHFRNLRPTWLLLSADIAHNKRMGQHMKYCEKIVSIGRLKWIPDSKHSGLDNCAWYLFQKDPCTTTFIGRT